MILIADSGSTKTNWIAINKDGSEVFKVNTEGLNPSVLNIDVLKNRIYNCKELFTFKDEIEEIHFYGAGCGTATPVKKLYSVLHALFENATIDIKEDSTAAVYAFNKEPAIVCILGTGSNCTLFDGEKVHQKITSLGYSIMDDASGNYFGRILLRDYYFNKMPKEFANKFEAQFNLDADFIKTNLYNKENPNTYLAHFAEFLMSHKKNDYAQSIIHKGLTQFIENQILQYNESKTLKVNFVGSIAYFLEEEIKELFKTYHLNFGNVKRHPINGLVAYHLNS